MHSTTVRAARAGLAVLALAGLVAAAPAAAQNHAGHAATAAAEAATQAAGQAADAAAQAATAAQAAAQAVAQTAGQPAAPAQAAPQGRLSPMAMARITLGDAYLRVVYSRPAKRGRDNIFGSEESKALVPYGKLWRTGANEATELTVTRDVTVAGQRLPAGTYSLFTTPGPDSWKIHVNTALGLSGTSRRNPESGEFEDAYSAAADRVAATVPAKTLDEEVEQFTIAFEKTADDAADLVLTWIRTEVRIPVQLAK